MRPAQLLLSSSQFFSTQQPPSSFRDPLNPFEALSLRFICHLPLWAAHCDPLDDLPVAGLQKENFTLEEACRALDEVDFQLAIYE